MGRGTTLFKRGAALLIVWALALTWVYRAGAEALEHHRLGAEVERLQSEHNARFDGYTELLAEGERLRNDEEAQIELLKGRLGYTEPDETPIIVLTQP